MAELIQTIEDDDVIKIEDEDSDSEEELTVATSKQRQEKKSEKKGFNTSFHFEDEGFYESTWSLESALHNAIRKKKLQTTLDQKIERVRRNRVGANKVVQQSSGIATGDDDEDEPNSDIDIIGETGADDVLNEKDARKIDTLRVKVERGRRKNLKQEEDDDEEDYVVPLAEVTDTVEGNKMTKWNSKLTFPNMNLSRPLLRAINNMNYITPTPIQQAAIPVALRGRDICACAATGTGKTAAFMLPVLERLIFGPVSTPVIRVLCLVPTRELAVQVFGVTQQLAQHTSIRACLAAGGLDMKSQEASLRQNPDIVVATPGRLIDHLHNTPSFILQYVEVLILDEADRMLDEHFEQQMGEIIKLCGPHRQTMLFSATMNDKVKGLAALSLTNPVKIYVNTNTDVAPFLRQEFIRIREKKEADREAIVLALCCRSFISNVLVFTQTKKQAHRLHIVFGLLGLKAGELHGNLSQEHRLENLKRFKDGQTDVLICTDLASRGLDIPNVKTVINFTMPPSHKDYVHRVGRTARAGKSGRSVSLVGEGERKLLKEIVKVAKNPVKSRTLPLDVISKFNEKLQEVESEVGEVLRLETHEKEILRAENQVKKGQKIMTGKTMEKRVWFQSKEEREKIQAEKRLDFFAKNPKRALKKNKSVPTDHKKTSTLTAEDRMQIELKKAKEYQRREEKRNRKQKRARAYQEDIGSGARGAPSKKKKRNSNFDVELTNVTKKAVVANRNLPNAKGKMAKKKKRK